MTADVGSQAYALWRAITYLSVAQLHLQANPLLTAPLAPDHVKPHPAGHWGTVPGTAFALTHVALAAATHGHQLMPVLGAGHAGVAQSALAWITGDLEAVRPAFSRDTDGLTRLVRAFPLLDGIGGEVSPLLPAGAYLGGQIGGALAFATGAALDAPRRIVVPVIGDGECETPTTAAAWLAATAVAGRSKVLPIVHVNGHRMGGPSLLQAMDDDELRSYAYGLGWNAHVITIRSADVDEHRAFHQRFLAAVAAVACGGRTVIFLRCDKGWSGPATVGTRQILGTARTHKTPISDPHGDPLQLSIITRWLSSYRPHDLFTAGGTPTGPLADAVVQIATNNRPGPAPGLRPRVDGPPPERPLSFADAVTSVVRRHAGSGDLRLFSPDELASNRLAHLADETWSIEVLAEEVLLGWLAGWTATGRKGLLISYEAFAPLLATGLAQLLKQRRLLRGAGVLPSINLLLTSYGWHNTYTHGDPSLITMLLATRDPAVRVFTPADPRGLAEALDNALSSSGRVNVILAGKHPAADLPAPQTGETGRGLGIWPQHSDPNPDLVLVASGDLPAHAVCAAAPILRRRHGVAVRVIAVHDLTILGSPATWPRGLSAPEVEHYLPPGVPVIIATLGHPAAIWGLLEGRLHWPVEVIGWAEPPHPVSQDDLAALAGMDPAGFCAAADRLAAAGALPPRWPLRAVSALADAVGTGMVSHG
jgi:xylulose-5-phosphate/fructose-6-phosphate phosphoketolase